MCRATGHAGRNDRLTARARGLGLAEILVGLALGLLIVGAGISVFIGQLQGHRQRLITLRLTQELRGAMTLMERDLRRAGYWQDADSALWQAGAASEPATNPYGAVHPPTGTATAVGYTYARNATDHLAVDSAERFGFRINANTRTLEMRLAGNALVPADGDAWQPVTNPTQVRITRLAFTTAARTASLADRCTAPCAPGTAGCPPTQTVRLLQIDLAGQSVLEPTLTRTLSTLVRVRSDAASGRCPP